VAVIDRLAGALEEVLGQPLQRKVMRDEQACVRVVADRSDIDGVLDASFDAIRQSGSGVPGILIKLADTFGKRAPAVTSPQARAALLRHLGNIRETADAAPLIASDRVDVLARVARAESALGSLS
jgi:uncharacterized membrane protein